MGVGVPFYPLISKWTPVRHFSVFTVRFGAGRLDLFDRVSFPLHRGMNVGLFVSCIPSSFLLIMIFTSANVFLLFFMGGQSILSYFLVVFESGRRRTGGPHPVYHHVAHGAAFLLVGF
jgi:hypothetical protein